MWESIITVWHFCCVATMQECKQQTLARQHETLVELSGRPFSIIFPVTSSRAGHNMPPWYLTLNLSYRRHTMTPLEKRLIEDMKLFGYSKRTQDTYLYAVRKITKHFQTSPDQITNEQLREYLLWHKDKYAPIRPAHPLGHRSRSKPHHPSRLHKTAPHAVAVASRCSLWQLFHGVGHGLKRHQAIRQHPYSTKSNKPPTLYET